MIVTRQVHGSLRPLDWYARQESKRERRVCRLVPDDVASCPGVPHVGACGSIASGGRARPCHVVPGCDRARCTLHCTLESATVARSGRESVPALCPRCDRGGGRGRPTRRDGRLIACCSGRTRDSMSRALGRRHGTLPRMLFLVRELERPGGGHHDRHRTTEPLLATDTWADQFEQLRARYKRVREPILAALIILLHEQGHHGLTVDDAKAQATLHGVKITAASVSAAQRLLSRMDDCRFLNPTRDSKFVRPLPPRPSAPGHQGLDNKTTRCPPRDPLSHRGRRCGC